MNFPIKPNREATGKVWAEYWAAIRVLADDAAKHDENYKKYVARCISYGWYATPYEHWAVSFRDAVVSQ